MDGPISRFIRELMTTALAVCFTGCQTYICTGNGNGIASPDDRYSLAVEVHGAYGHSYFDKTTKRIWIEILNRSDWKYKAVLSQTYSLTGSDIDWQIHWSSPEEVSVEFYDWGDGVGNYNNMKHITASNHIALFSFILDTNTVKFVEKK